MPAAIARRGECAAGRTLPPMRISPLSKGRSPKMARASSVRPAPTSPATPTISPAPHREGDVAKQAALVEALHLQHGIADRRGFLAEEVADVAADHHAR